jgi:hypothetical protein
VLEFEPSGCLGAGQTEVKNNVEICAEQPCPTDADPLLCDAELPLSDTLYPLGFPLILESNSKLIIAAGQESWGDFRKEFDAPPIHIRAGVFDEPGAAVLDAPVFRGSNHLISIVAGPSDSACCDLNTGCSFCWVTQETAARGDYFRYFFLEAMTYLGLSGLHITGVHAACVAHKGKGVLLCGTTEAGKSSLAYACGRRGWTYVCDDSANLLTNAEQPAVVGDCHSLRLRPDAPALFPELGPFLPVERPTGKLKLELRTADLADFQVTQRTQIDRIVFLARDPAARCEFAGIDEDEAFARLMNIPPFGPASVRQAWQQTVRRLVQQVESVEFAYWDLEAAVSRLEDLVDQGG